MYIKHYYVARYLSLPELMGSAFFRPSLCTNPSSTPKIYTSIYHWNGYSITHHLGIWINTGVLNP